MILGTSAFVKRFNQVTIKGDEGGRQILANPRQDLATVSLSSELPLLDVDTLEDYKNLIQDKKL